MVRSGCRRRRRRDGVDFDPVRVRIDDIPGRDHVGSAGDVRADGNRIPEHKRHVSISRTRPEPDEAETAARQQPEYGIPLSLWRERTADRRVAFELVATGRPRRPEVRRQTELQPVRLADRQPLPVPHVAERERVVVEVVGDARNLAADKLAGRPRRQVDHDVVVNQHIADRDRRIRVRIHEDVVVRPGLLRPDLARRRVPGREPRLHLRAVVAEVVRPRRAARPARPRRSGRPGRPGRRQRFLLDDRQMQERVVRDRRQVRERHYELDAGRAVVEARHRRSQRRDALQPRNDDVGIPVPEREVASGLDVNRRRRPPPELRLPVR